VRIGFRRPHCKKEEANCAAFHAGQEGRVSARGSQGKEKNFTAVARVDTPFEVAYYQHGGILHYVLRQML
jgi:aconitase A